MRFKNVFPYWLAREGRFWSINQSSSMKSLNGVWGPVRFLSTHHPLSPNSIRKGWGCRALNTHSNFHSKNNASTGSAAGVEACESGDAEKRPQGDMSVSSGDPIACLHPMWVERLKRLKTPCAIKMAEAVCFTNALGIPLRKSIRQPWIASFLMEKKLKQPFHMYLIRVGGHLLFGYTVGCLCACMTEFYEAYGIDAIMLVELCGLRPMAGKLQAGFRAQSLQTMLDILIQDGRSAAIYEEVDDLVIPSRGSGANKTRKVRVLSQVVSELSPIYLHGLELQEGRLMSDEASWRPAVGVRYDAGTRTYQLVRLEVPTQTATIAEGLTLEGVLTRLVMNPPASPVYFHLAPQLPNVKCLETENGHPYRELISFFKKQSMDIGRNSSTHRFIQCPPGSFPAYLIKSITSLHALKINAFDISHENENGFSALAGIPFLRKRVTQELASTGHKCVEQHSSASPRPVSPALASHIGIVPQGRVAPLIPYVVEPDSAWYIRQTMTSWLLNPPPYEIADAVQELCHLISGMLPSLLVPTLKVSGAKKLTTLVTARQCNAETFRSLVASLDAIEAFTTQNRGENPETFDRVVVLLWSLVRFHHGNKYFLDYETFFTQLKKLRDTVSNIILPEELLDDVPLNSRVYEILHGLGEQVGDASDGGDPVNGDLNDGTAATAYFCTKIESCFRGRVRRTSGSQVEGTYQAVEDAVDGILQSALSTLGETVATVASIKNDSEEGSASSVRLAALKLRRPLKFNSSTWCVNVRKGWADRNTRAQKERDPSIALLPATHRNGSRVRSLYSSSLLEEAVQSYRLCVGEARRAVKKSLVDLCATVEAQMNIVILASTFLTLLQTVVSHARQAKKQGWCLPTLEPLEFVCGGLAADVEDRLLMPSENDPVRKKEFHKRYPLVLQGLTPYWLARDVVSENVSNATQSGEDPILSAGFYDAKNSSCLTKDTQESNDAGVASLSETMGVPTDITLDGMAMLTAPNMAGKSSLIRALTTTCILASCGLFVPCTTAWVPRFDGFFIQAGTGDVPLEHRSAFGQEMFEAAMLLKHATDRSLVVVDEMGRGTCYETAVAIGAACLEFLMQRNCYGIFSTHLRRLLAPDFAFHERCKQLSMDFAIVDEAGDQERRDEGITHAVGMSSANQVLPLSCVVPHNIVWKYRVREGPCTAHSSFGLFVAKQFGVPAPVLERAIGWERHLATQWIENDEVGQQPAVAT